MDATEIEKQIRDKFIALPQISSDAEIDHIPIRTLGVDSIDFIDLIVALEKDHNIAIAVDKLDDQITLASLIASAYIITHGQ